jgi:hypothetical protein
MQEIFLCIEVGALLILSCIVDIIFVSSKNALPNQTGNDFKLRVNGYGRRR